MLGGGQGKFLDGRDLVGVFLIARANFFSLFLLLYIVAPQQIIAPIEKIYYGGGYYDGLPFQ